MVCIRCKMAVQTVLEKNKIKYLNIELGKVQLSKPLTEEQKIKLNADLQHYKLELMEEKKKIIVELVKTSIIEILNSSEMDMNSKFSVYLSNKLNFNYTYLANIFSELEGSTIERFYIETRVERVKELIVYEDLSLTEIGYQLNYSSVSHLCNQFKKVSGHTPAIFKKLCQSDDFIWKKI